MFWLATTAFVLISQGIVGVVWPPDEPEPVWFRVTSPSETSKTILLAAFSYFVARSSLSLFIGPNAARFAWAAAAAVPLWIFFLRGGIFSVNYASVEWIGVTLVLMAIPVATAVLGARRGHREGVRDRETRGNERSGP